MVMKVYGSPISACTHRVLTCLVEKGVDYEFIHINIPLGEHKKPDFLLLQPFGKVPVVEDGDFKLFESRAIARYLAEKYAEHGPDLVGKTLEERAMVDQWLQVELNYLNDPIFNLVMQRIVLPKMMGEIGDESLAQISEQKLEKVLDVYEKRLSESTFLAGESFSLADLSNIPLIRYVMEDLNLSHFITARKSVSAWWQNISNRPSWKKVLETSRRI